jgi:hypothetical protein
MAKQEALKPLDALPGSILSLFPPQKPAHPKYPPDVEKRLHSGEDIKKEIGGVWMVNLSCPKLIIGK